MLLCFSVPGPTSVHSLTQVQCCCVFLLLALPRSIHWHRYNVAVSFCSWPYLGPFIDTGTMLLCFSVPSPTSVHSLTQVQCCCVFLLLALPRSIHWHRYNVAVSFCSWPYLGPFIDTGTMLLCLSVPSPTSVHSLTQVQCCCVFLFLALPRSIHWHRYNVAVFFCS